MRYNIRINCLEIVTPISLFDVNSWIDCLEIVTPIYLFDVNSWIDCFETLTPTYLLDSYQFATNTKSIGVFEIQHETKILIGFVWNECGEV